MKVQKNSLYGMFDFGSEVVSFPLPDCEMSHNLVTSQTPNDQDNCDWDEDEEDEEDDDEDDGDQGEDLEGENGDEDDDDPAGY